MNCSQCREEISYLTDLITLQHIDGNRAFCDWPCLRAWLGPDRPLSRRVEQPQKPAPSPQHVVAQSDCELVHPGESHAAWLERVYKSGQFNAK